MIELRTIAENDWAIFRDIRLQALDEAPYAFSTELSEWQGRGDSEERWRGRLRNVPFNVVAYLDAALAGMISAFEVEPSGDVELISAYVAPFARGRGVGDALLECALEWAAQHGGRRATLGVIEGNTAAIALYERHGFVDDGPAGDDSEGAVIERRMVRPIGV